jgi:hypothetical protein
VRCGGRRQLVADQESCAEVCVDKDEEIRRLEEELEKSKAEIEHAVQRSAQKDMFIEQQSKTIETQANEIAFHKRLHRLRHISDLTRRNQSIVGRRTQTSTDSSVLRSARVGSDRLVKACAVHPCELGDGICQNGGVCVEGAAEGGGAVPFECQCASNFGGDRCQTDLCESVDCGQHGECVGGVCECTNGWTGDRCELDPCIGADLDCGGHGQCVEGSCDCEQWYSGDHCEIASPCAGEYVVVPDDPYFRVSAGQSLPGANYDPSMPEVRCDAYNAGGPFGMGRATTAWYRLPASHGLATTPPGTDHCGTYASGWLTGFGAGLPPFDYSLPADGSLPPPAEAPPASGTVCFDLHDHGPGRGACESHVAVRAVSCGTFSLWELPPTPGCTMAYCLAA